MISPEGRASAARSVLSGRPVEEVAEELAVERELVRRWVDLFLEGGSLRVAGRMDPTSFEARDRFLTLIGHEFRTPLTVIRGWVETLGRAELPDRTRAMALEQVDRQVAHLARIAEDAIDAGAVARGELRLDIEDVDLVAMLARVAAAREDVVVPVGSRMVVSADAARLEQIANAVIGHAARLSTAGPVRVNVDGSAAGTVTVEFEAHGRELGYDDALAIFEPFTRADSSIGTGLGLFLSRALLVAHGGEIGVRSEGSETTFWFRLPRTGPPNDGARAERS